MRRGRGRPLSTRVLQPAITLGDCSAKSKPEILIDIRDEIGRIIMPQAYADLCIAFVRLAAIQVGFGLVAAEIAAFGFHPMRDIPAVGEVDPTPFVSHAELDAATQVLKGKLLAVEKLASGMSCRSIFQMTRSKRWRRPYWWPRTVSEINLASMQRHVGAQGSVSRCSSAWG
jgi:hypothetical protein